MVSRNNPKILSFLKDSISRHVFRIFQGTLRFTVEQAIL